MTVHERPAQETELPDPANLSWDEICRIAERIRKEAHEAADEQRRRTADVLRRSEKVRQRLMRAAGE